MKNVAALVLVAFILQTPANAESDHGKSAGKDAVKDAVSRPLFLGQESKATPQKAVCGTIDQYRAIPKMSGDRDLAITTKDGLKARIQFTSTQNQQSLRDSIPATGCVTFNGATAIGGTYLKFSSFTPQTAKQLSGQPSVEGFQTQCGTVDVWHRPSQRPGDNDLAINTAQGRKRLIFADGLETLDTNFRSQLPLRVCLGYVTYEGPVFDSGDPISVIAVFEEVPAALR